MTRRAPLAVLLASPEDIEAQFYEALQTGDVERLMALWVADEGVRCIPATGQPRVGSAALRELFTAFLAQGGVPIEPTEVGKVQTEHLAVHHVRERRMEPGPEGLRATWVQATNVYRKTAEGWRMVLHHASTLPASVAAPPAATAPAVLH